MPYVLNLEDTCRRALQVIRDRGAISGWELLAATQMNPQQLVAAIQPLLKNDVIGFSGCPYDAEGVLQSFFNLRPSARDLVDFTLRSAP